MFRLAALLLACMTVPTLNAQYTTPGTGVHWTMDSLAANGEGIVELMAIGYLVTDELTVTEGDTLSIFGPNIVSFDSDAMLTVAGHLITSPQEGGTVGPVLTTFIGGSDNFGGIRVEESGWARFYDTEFSNGGGIKCISGDIVFDGCLIQLQVANATNNSAIEFSTGRPMIVGTEIRDNPGSAISTSANGSCAPVVSFCHIENNNTDNTNRPQINLGPSGTETITIEETSVIGNPANEMVGGIAVATLVGGEASLWFRNNTISDNRYGIAVLGNEITAFINDNIITDNTSQGDPLLGGSGINLNGGESSSATLVGNTIEGNLWGVTVQGVFGVDMGDPTIDALSPGLNIFSDNGNGGVTYAIYNNTPLGIPAINNCWLGTETASLEDIEAVIFHAVDDLTLGQVDFSDPLCDIVDDLEESTLGVLRLYPIPCSDALTIDLAEGARIVSTHLIDHTGRMLDARHGPGGRVDTTDLSPGIYQVVVHTDRGSYTGTMVKSE